MPPEPHGTTYLLMDTIAALRSGMDGLARFQEAFGDATLNADASATLHKWYANALAYTAEMEYALRVAQRAENQGDDDHDPGKLRGQPHHDPA